MRTLATFLAFLSLLCLSAQNQNDKGLYIDSEGALFSGQITKTDPSTSSGAGSNYVTAQFTVKEGQIDGPVEYFYASGNVLEKGTFTKGQKDQKWTRFNENGSVSAIAFYNLGKKTGTWLVFDESGKKRFEMNYHDGEKVGTWTNWDENGNVASSKDYGKLN